MNKNQMGPFSLAYSALKSFEKQGVKIDGEVSLTRNMSLLTSAHLEDIPSPGIKNASQTGSANLDKISLHQNIWLQITNRQRRTDTILLPLMFELDFGAKLRRGIRMKTGWT